MAKHKPYYRKPLLCLSLYSLVIIVLLFLPLPALLKACIAILLSLLLGNIWHKNAQHQNAHREELRMIANTVEDAMWSLQYNGVIEWMNPAFISIFQAEEEQRYHKYTEVIRIPVVLDFVKEFMHNREERLSEISFDDHYYLISGSVNYETQRMVFIMQNIDIIRQTENMKRDFMVNIAHELRTPLTAIKGFTLALEEDFTPDNKRYLTIIKRHTERLINLISDLQTLAKLERLPGLDMQEIDLQQFMDNILALYQHTLEEEGLYLKYEQQPADICLRVDPFKFEQIFINLIDNARQYTREGGITITSSLTQDDVIITVQDTGIGIAPQHLPRIFERFYVADPSRNKKTSGTGLGLAIVKHIVQLHHGHINVRSKQGSGTSFAMAFPLHHQD